jgi:hypothetical protein
MNLDWARGVGRYKEIPSDAQQATSEAEKHYYLPLMKSCGKDALCYEGKLFEQREPDIDERAGKVRGRKEAPRRWRDFLRDDRVAPRSLLDGNYREQLIGGPDIVCLCGSTRFHDEFQKANYRLTMEGKIVLSVGFFVHGLSDGELCERLIKAAEGCNVAKGEWLSMGFWRSMLAIIRGAHSEDVGCTPEQKEKLDDLHLRKIDLSTEVHVLNKGGYIGSSTQRELAYAIMLARKISFLDPEAGAKYLDDSVKQHELGAHIARFMEASR